MAPSLPKSYKVAVFKKVDEPLTIEEVDLKEPEAGEVLIKVEACGVCHSDAEVKSGHMGNSFPIIPGHEMIGKVVAVGPGDKPLYKIGDRIGAGWHGGHDGNCKACKKGFFQMCENAAVNGVSRNGGYAEYCTLREEAAVHIPSHADAASYAPLLCAGVTVFNSMRRLQIPPGEVVAIQGLGGLGHLAIQYAHKMGYKVVALSSSGSKEKFAHELGATEYLDASKIDHAEGLQKLGGASMIVVTAPNPKIIGALLPGLGIQGKLLILAPVGEVQINTLPMVAKGLSVHSFPSGHAQDSEAAIEFAELTGVNCMVEKFPLAEANKAFDHMMGGHVYKGKDEILLSKLILEPSHSILTQSYDSRLRLDTRRPHNGDGFGVGYYTSPALGPCPCLFTSTIPAWNCINLSRLAAKTTSSLIFAHVRATTSGALADANCHPFRHRTLMFMHNGSIAAWPAVKRALAASLADPWFLFVQGGTDSEWAFALFLDSMQRMGVDPSAEPAVAGKGFGHGVLRAALRRTVERINELVGAVQEGALDAEGRRSLLNFAVTDGVSVVCTRYVSSRTDEAASLYWSSGTSWRDEGGGRFVMERRDRGADIVLVASEPLTFERAPRERKGERKGERADGSRGAQLDNWVTVPTNSILTIHKQTVMVHPIVDEYYNHSPSYSRRSDFAKSKGLVSSAPGVTEVLTPAAEEDGDEDVDGDRNMGGDGKMVEEEGAEGVDAVRERRRGG
ncbi:hypothetical protein MMC34_002312 [Xylographa carneopallida]|nr:hypothetical protein [Xylographa carneopallida]